MKLKLITLSAVLVLVLSGCSSEEAAETTTAETTVAETTAAETTASETSLPETSAESAQETATVIETDGDLSELDSLGEIDVDKTLFDVTINVPADFIGETTQEELDQAASEYGYKVVLNDDGSATYTMTKDQHRKMLEDLTTSTNETLQEMVGSEDYPNITEIKANDDFTEFTVTTKNTELDMAESFSVLVFYMSGGLYGIFSGETPENISVTFINADTGEVITTANSSEMGE